MDKRPTLAVWKFSSCDGCQLSLLDVEDDLLAIAASVHIAHFLEASSATVAGPYDVSLVEGSITTPEEAERNKEVRAASRMLVTIGACATAGGIQALRNYAQIEDYVAAVYASPEYISTLDTSTAIAAAARSTSSSCSSSCRRCCTDAAPTSRPIPSASSARAAVSRASWSRRASRA